MDLCHRASILVKRFLKFHKYIVEWSTEILQNIIAIKLLKNRKFGSYILNKTAAVQKQRFMSSKVHIEFSEADCTKVHMIRLTAMKIG